MFKHGRTFGVSQETKRKGNNMTFHPQCDRCGYPLDDDYFCQNCQRNWHSREAYDVFQNEKDEEIADYGPN